MNPPSRSEKRQDFRPKLLTIFATLSFLLWVTTLPGQSRFPNVIILLADDLGSKDIGCDGGPVNTPALDSLAAKGVRFTNFYAAAPVCSPARASLLTGRHHLRTGVYTVIQDHIHDTHLLKSEVTIAEVLKANGYDTAHVGKWHLGTPFRGMKKPWIDEHGFDYWFATDLNAAPSHRNPVNFWRNRERVGELKGYACQLVVDEAIDWLDQKRDAAKPFFLNVWFHEPHAPLAAPDNIVAQYGDLKDQAAIYSGTIDHTDRAIARLLKKLEQMGSLENTIVIYTSDHGSYRKERNGELRGSKGSLFEGGIRTPGIFYWPKRIESGRTESTPACAIDLLPTICGLVGIEKPSGVRLDGTDLSPVLTGNPSTFNREQPLTWHSPLSQPVIAVRDGNYSLVGFRKNEYPKDQDAIKPVMDAMRVILERHLDRKLTPAELWDQCYNRPLKTPEWNRLRGEFVALQTFQEAWIPLIKSGSGGMSRFELYDLSTDPGQKQNVADRFPEVTARLKRKVLAINAELLAEAPLWGESKKSLRVHQLDSTKRSCFDAFVYVNRIPAETESDETQDGLAGRILGRLANQEGRILVKLPLGMKRPAYEGFKIALGSDSRQNFRSSTKSCIACHNLPDLGNAASSPPTPSLRNRSYTQERLWQLLRNETHQAFQITKNEADLLHAFLQTLSDVPDAQFRDLILKTAVLDSSGESK
ncbi:MAG: sulfatase-like hydrolase/transferase [Pirellulaceae bacterium]